MGEVGLAAGGSVAGSGCLDVWTWRLSSGSSFFKQRCLCFAMPSNFPRTTEPSTSYATAPGSAYYLVALSSPFKATDFHISSVPSPHTPQYPPVYLSAASHATDPCSPPKSQSYN